MAETKIEILARIDELQRLKADYCESVVYVGLTMGWAVSETAINDRIRELRKEAENAE